MSHDGDDAEDSERVDRTTEIETNPTTVRHEWRGAGHPSEVLVNAVAAPTDRTPTDLPPLYETIDPDALDVLLTGRQSSSVSLSFRYADTAVRIGGDGAIDVRIDGHPARGDHD